MLPELNNFLVAIRDDNRISAVHISLFIAIIQCWDNNNCNNPISVFSHDLMPLAKISGLATYHKSIKELHEYGYIKYQPSFDHYTKSLIYINHEVEH